MAKLIKNDPLAVCPFYKGFNDHAVVCDGGNGIVISRAFTYVSECIGHREDFCRYKVEKENGEILFAFPACPYYAVIFEEGVLKGHFDSFDHPYNKGHK